MGTLYRHFPDRNDLAAAAYEDELVQVAARARAARDIRSPGRPAPMDGPVRHPLREQTDDGARPAVADRSGTVTAGSTRARLGLAAQEILDAGIASGDFRPGSNGDDLVVALVGLCMATASDPDGEQLGRLFDLLVTSVTV